MREVSQVQKRVEQALLTDDRTKDQAIGVLDKNGVITLQGVVASREVYDHAEQVAQKQPGVVQVLNEIDVRPEDSGDLLSPPDVSSTRTPSR